MRFAKKIFFFICCIFFILFLFGVSSSIVIAACDATNCSTGCCLSGVCYPGTETIRCGVNAQLCTNCTLTGKVCLGQTCVTAPTPTPICTRTTGAGGGCVVGQCDVSCNAYCPAGYNICDTSCITGGFCIVPDMSCAWQFWDGTKTGSNGYCCCPNPTNTPVPTSTPAPVCDPNCSGIYYACSWKDSQGICRFPDWGNPGGTISCCHLKCVPYNPSGTCQYVAGSGAWDCAICGVLSPTPTLTPTPTPGVCVPACPSAPLPITPLNLGRVNTLSITLSWSVPTSWGKVCSGVENNHYHLYASTTGVGPSGTLKDSSDLFLDRIDVSNTPNPSYTFTLPILTEGQKYYWQVYAVNQ